MRGMSTVNSLAIILAINCWLFTGGTPNVCGQSNPTANDLRSNTPQSSSTQSVTETQSNNDDDLPWLPGLGGRTLGDRNSVTGQGGLPQQNQYAQPPIATQAINARPLPGNTIPRSVMTDIRSLTSAPEARQASESFAAPNSAPPPAPRAIQQPLPTDLPYTYNNQRGVVTPVAFLTQEESPNNSNQPTTQPTNQVANQAQGNQQNPGSDPIFSQVGSSNRMQQLPNDAGQVWRSYDISPYTYSVQTKTRPEQAVVDWVLKETGTEMWFTQPMGVLSATRDKLHVYHTPAIHNRIKPIVDRFVQSRGRQLVVGLKMMTIASPDWRTSAISMMQPIQVSSPGVEAWLMTKENAAILSGMLRNRADYQEQSNNDLIVANGQQYNMENTRPVEFLRSIGLSQDNTRYQALNGRIDEGYSIDFSTLSSLDGRSIEAIVGCDINQIEKMQRVSVDLPTAAGQTQPFDLQIPQMVRWNVRERFRWPSDMVLVLSCGVVATPGPQRQALLGLPSLFNGNRRRADALMFIEYKGLAQTLAIQQPNQQPIQAAPGGNTASAAQTGLVPVTPRR